MRKRKGSGGNERLRAALVGGYQTVVRRHEFFFCAVTLWTGSKMWHLSGAWKWGHLVHR